MSSPSTTARGRGPTRCATPHTSPLAQHSAQANDAASSSASSDERACSAEHGPSASCASEDSDDERHSPPHHADDAVGDCDDDDQGVVAQLNRLAGAMHNVLDRLRAVENHVMVMDAATRGGDDEAGGARGGGADGDKALEVHAPQPQPIAECSVSGRAAAAASDVYAQLVRRVADDFRRLFFAAWKDELRQQRPVVYVQQSSSSSSSSSESEPEPEPEPEPVQACAYCSDMHGDEHRKHTWRWSVNEALHGLHTRIDRLRGDMDERVTHVEARVASVAPPPSPHTVTLSEFLNEPPPLSSPPASPPPSPLARRRAHDAASAAATTSDAASDTGALTWCASFDQLPFVHSPLSSAAHIDGTPPPPATIDYELLADRVAQRVVQQLSVLWAPPAPALVNDSETAEK